MIKIAVSFKKVTEMNSIINSRKPRILWVCAYCLLDTTSGGAMSVKKILHQLRKSGYLVEILGATNFDNAVALDQLKYLKKAISDQTNPEIKFLEIEDDGITHRLVRTRTTQRQLMNTEESNLLFTLYVDFLERFKPDLIFFYGGTLIELLITAEARARNIPSVAYLVNENYQGTRWCRDVDLIITDTAATSNYYQKKYGFNPKPIGKFIEFGDIVPKDHQRTHLTFVNPEWAKGGAIVAVLAILLNEQRPDIPIEVVESRGDWTKMLEEVSRQVFNKTISNLDNVKIQKNTSKMYDVYGRSRCLIAPSLWRESGARVLAEAMINGIPALISDVGGNREMTGPGGIVLEIPKDCFERPYNKIPPMKSFNSIITTVKRLWDDKEFYSAKSAQAAIYGLQNFQLGLATQRLIEEFTPLLEAQAGNYDQTKIIEIKHKHKVKEELVSELSKQIN